MFNPYSTTLAKVKDIKQESSEVKLFTLAFTDKKFKNNFQAKAGQIVEIGIPGFGEGPFAICSCIEEKDYFQICVRRIGKLTTQMHSVKIGDMFTVRGPYGLGVFPEIKRNFLLVAGGIGLIPLRPFIYKYMATLGQSHIAPLAQLFYGARSQDDFIFKDEYRKWKKYIDMHITLDKEESGWDGHTGLITTLFDDIRLAENPIVILCGPPVMYKFVVEKLKQLNFKDEDIYMSLERRIHCGIGLCQHCAIGSKYICKDGPVFRWKDVKDINGVI